MDRALGGDRPLLFAGLPVEGVETLVVTADEHGLADDHRGGLDLGAGGEGPAGGSGLGVHGVEDTQQVADEYQPGGDRGGGFPEAVLFEVRRRGGRLLPLRRGGRGPRSVPPLLGPVFEVEFHQEAGEGGRIHEAPGDGRGALDGEAQGNGPEQGRGCSRPRGGDAGEGRIAAELGPVALVRFFGDGGGGAGGREDESTGERCFADAGSSAGGPQPGGVFPVQRSPR